MTERGIVYILTNESMPDIIKIGRTKDLPKRLKDLDNTSTPLPFECFYAVEVDDAKTVEALLHETFDDKKVRPKREFFNCTPEQAKSALKIAEKTGGGKDVTPKETVFETEQDKQALAKAKSRKEKVDYFGILGINSGETLTFSKDSSITCQVADGGQVQVQFRGEITTLSRAALIILSEMDYDWQKIQGAAYWCYEGKSLLDLYRSID